MEVNESRNGIRVRRYALNTEACGAGRFRGGKGVELHYEIVESKGWVTAGYTRFAVPPWGLAGGGQGTGNRIEITRGGADPEVHGEVNNLPLRKGDVVRIITRQRRRLRRPPRSEARSASGGTCVTVMFP